MKRRLDPRGRELIEGHLQDGWSLRVIARAARVAPSIISREVARNGGKRRYQAKAAQVRADACRVGVGPSPVGDEVWRAAIVCLKKGWSPEQIGSRLPISSATTRRRVRQDRADGGKLFRMLRHRGKPRRSPAWRAAQKCKSIPGRVHFSQRPQGADDRGEFVHWETDTLFDRGSRHTSGIVLLLSERKSREARMEPIREMSAAACATAALARRLNDRPMKTHGWKSRRQVANGI